MISLPRIPGPMNWITKIQEIADTVKAFVQRSLITGAEGWYVTLTSLQPNLIINANHHLEIESRFGLLLWIIQNIKDRAVVSSSEA